LIKTIWQYSRDEIKPRFKDIILGSELWIAGIIGVVCAYAGDDLIGHTKVGDIVGGLLTYASIAFGFCLSGLTIALTLPSQDFVKKLASTKLGGKKNNAFSDLLFVFSWTALCHWLVIVLTIGSILLLGSNAIILPHESYQSHRIIFGFVLFISIYGIFQFLITLITISQVGRLYIDHINKKIH
jgi:hypothetical protein